MDPGKRKLWRSIVGTANDVSQFRPETLRKGRFDALLFVDLPNQSERAKLKRRQIGAKTVQIKLRYSDFTTLTRQLSIEEPVTEAIDIYRLACHILARERLVSRPLRLIGLGVSSLGETVSRQLVFSLR